MSLRGAALLAIALFAVGPAAQTLDSEGERIIYLLSQGNCYVTNAETDFEGMRIGCERPESHHRQAHG